VVLNISCQGRRRHEERNASRVISDLSRILFLIVFHRVAL
jgi:hypothetical protein